MAAETVRQLTAFGTIEHIVESGLFGDTPAGEEFSSHRDDHAELHRLKEAANTLSATQGSVPGYVTIAIFRVEGRVNSSHNTRQVSKDVPV